MPQPVLTSFLPLPASSSADPVAAQVTLPLCADLDGTLTRTDTLGECVLLLLKANPLLLFLALGAYVRGGRAGFKEFVTARVALDVAALPYHETFLEFLRAQKATGRRLVLVTGADQAMANRVASAFGDLFDEALGSSERVNLVGAHKAARLTEKFGPRGFAYAGNSSADLHVWSAAGEVIIVNAAPALRRRAERAFAGKIRAVFDPPQPMTLRLWFEAMRVHQWVKNVLLFVPFLAAHQWARPGYWLLSVTAYVAFGLCASSVYLVNDLFDLEADRNHPRKRRRAFAAGSLPLFGGAVMAVLLLVLGVGFAALVSWEFFLMTLVYLATTLAYSLWLKRAEIVDVLILAGLYTIRLLAGGAAVHVPLSAWLLAFSMFMFLSLALVKRFNELQTLRKENLTLTRGRGYRVSDAEPIASMGIASGYLAVLVLALYVNSPDGGQLYQRPLALWALCPMIFYWVSRVWLLTHRDQLHEDPVVFALHDRRSYVLGALGVLVLLLAQPR